MAKAAKQKPAPEAGAAKTAAAAAPKPGFTIKPSKQTCMVLGGLMGVTLLGSAGLYFWQSGEIAAVEQKVREKQEEVASGEKIARRLTEVENEHAEMQNQLRFLETSVTAKEYVPTMLKQMDGLAKSVNLKVASVRPTLEPPPPPPADKEARKKAPPPPPYDKLHVDMEVSGTYWNVAKMVYRLTEFPKIMAVETVQISPVASATNTSQPELSVRMKLTGFIFPNEDKAAVPAGGPISPAAPAAPAGAAPAGGTPAGAPRASADAKTPAARPGAV